MGEAKGRFEAEIEMQREAAEQDVLARLERLRSEGREREVRLQAQLNQARIRHQEVSDRGREREEIYDQDRQAWELKHRAAVERAERAEAWHAKATAEGARALSA